MRNYVNARGRRKARSIIQYVLLPMCIADRASFFKQLSMQLRTPPREPIKVQARDLVSRQEPVPRISGCRENSFGILPENTFGRSYARVFLHIRTSFQLILPEMKFSLNQMFDFTL